MKLAPDSWHIFATLDPLWHLAPFSFFPSSHHLYFKTVDCDRRQNHANISLDSATCPTHRPCLTSRCHKLLARSLASEMVLPISNTSDPVIAEFFVPILLSVPFLVFILFRILKFYSLFSTFHMSVSARCLISSNPPSKKTQPRK